MKARTAKRKTAHAREIISRSGSVTEWDLDVHAWATGDKPDARKRQDGVHLTLRGDFNEEVAGVTRFDLLVWPEDQPEAGRSDIPSVGTFLRAKPVLEGALVLSEVHFQALLSVVVAGRLSAVAVTFQKPRYGSGLISSVMLSTSKTP
jgi:hypothetical protein